mgnify:CR=1 FL=1
MEPEVLVDNRTGDPADGPPHDAALNPIRAKVSLGLRVLTYNDLPFAHPGAP